MNTKAFIRSILNAQNAVVFIYIMMVVALVSCVTHQHQSDPSVQQIEKELTAKEIFDRPDNLAISYGGYRQTSREIQPTMAQLKEDLLILRAMHIKLIRTYNVELEHASNVLKAIRALKEQDPSFEMYVMLGAWINCLHAHTDHPDHSQEDEEFNSAEIGRAVKLAQQYPDIVKVIAVGNEAMVRWAASYYVQPEVILKWVRHLQSLKREGALPKHLWITSSDNFASWGGGDKSYHTPELKALIKAVDFVSLHTYPMHDTHYNPSFWGILPEEKAFTVKAKMEQAMIRASNYAINQYEETKAFVHSIDSTKPVHIGETGWASQDNSLYGANGSNACDEYKQGLYYRQIREWTQSEDIICFYFEAFDEPWKDANNPSGSENHFGLFTVDGKAKYAIWPVVDQGVFKGLSRDQNPIQKTHQGDPQAVIKASLIPPMQ